MNGNNPFESLKQLGQMRQFQKMFGEDFFKNLPIPDMGGQNFAMPFFNQGGDAEFPKADVYEQGSEVIAILEIPGLNSSTDVSLSVRSNRLIVQGHIDKLAVREDKVISAERHHGPFTREISLPISVVPDTARAAYKNGLLEVYMVKEDEKDERPRGSVPIDFA